MNIKRVSSDERRATPPEISRKFRGLSPGNPSDFPGSNGYALPLVIVVMVILIILTVGTMMASYGSRLQAVRVKAETEAMLAAEAGYERAIFWMSQQTDILTAIQSGLGSGTIDFGTSNCSYQVQFQGFMGARPVFKVLATGISGRPTFTRVVDVSVIQETNGWAMGACRIPNGTSSTLGVNFVNGEIIDIPLHINKANDSPDIGDIFISGNPTFLRKAEMSESRKTSGGSDKNVYTQSTSGSLTLRGSYSAVMPLFHNGIYFDQPNIRITDEDAVKSKIDRFRTSTAAGYQFTPTASSISGLTPKYPAVQLEFFVDGGVGKVRITNNCTVKALHAPTSNYDGSRDYSGTWDYKVVPESNPATFHKYDIYSHHYRRTSSTPPDQTTVAIESTYVTQTFQGYTSEAGGQIYVKGNVVIGSADYDEMVVKGKITVVVERNDDGTGGHIWLADSIKVDDNGGTQRDADGKPSANNPNVLGLIAQGVIKVVDPRQSDAPSYSGLIYQPIGNTKFGCPVTERYLPDQTVVEAALTVGGGGWGAENVGSRREYDGNQDYLVVRGSITEVIRGVVGISGTDGYIKNYYIDTRLMSGILPGDIWFSGKYIPAPAGWHDHSINN